MTPPFPFTPLCDAMLETIRSSWGILATFAVADAASLYEELMAYKCLYSREGTSRRKVSRILSGHDDWSRHVLGVHRARRARRRSQLHPVPPWRLFHPRGWGTAVPQWPDGVEEPHLLLPRRHLTR